MSLSGSIYPSPILTYQGGGAVLQPAKLVLGTVPIGQLAPVSVGFNYYAECKNGIPGYALRPASSPVEDAEPYNYVAYFYYQQGGVAWNDIVFSLKPDEAGGVLGTAAALEVCSNYPGIPMTLGKFTFSQPGFGTQVHGNLPGDYVARLALKFWIQQANPALDGWIRLETHYVRPQATDGAPKPPPLLVSTGSATLYPSPDGGPDCRVLGNSYE